MEEKWLDKEVNNKTNYSRLYSNLHFPTNMICIINSGYVDLYNSYPVNVYRCVFQRCYAAAEAGVWKGKEWYRNYFVFGG